MQKIGLDKTQAIPGLLLKKRVLDGAMVNFAGKMTEFCFSGSGRGSPEKREEIFKIGG